MSRLEHLIATSTHAIDECICDAIIIVDESGQGQASLLGQRIFQRKSARRHFCAEKQRKLETKRGLAERSEAKEQEKEEGGKCKQRNAMRRTGQ